MLSRCEECGHPDSHYAFCTHGSYLWGYEEGQRVALWTVCPHVGKYGDDGEMQCRGEDFKRNDSILLLTTHVQNAIKEMAYNPSLDEALNSGDGSYRP